MLRHIVAQPPWQCSIQNSHKSTEIRLLDLAPGNFTDTIRFCLWHTSLPPPAPSQRQRISLEELKTTLPRGWTAAETEQDRYRFIFEEDETENTSWTHPDPRIDPELWQPLEELSVEGYQPAYEALSYTWGAGGNLEVASVEYSPSRSHHNRKQMQFSMQENLASALRHLRYPDRIRKLWIDAICINQKDDAEKTHQVKQMWLLYRLSRRVVVWLGSEIPNSKSALSTLKHLGSQLEVSRDNRRYRSPQATEAEWFRAVYQLPYEKKTWQAIDDLFHRTWFERLWIWQEIQLANSQAIAVCGREKIPWQILRRAVICLTTKQDLPKPSLRRRLELIEPLTNERGSSSMNLLLNISRQRECTNPKDKIYGMLSICGPRLSKKIEPHYAEDWSTGDVYKDVFVKYLKQTNRLDLLSSCDSTLHQGTDPSWVPNWAVPRNTWPLYGYTFASGVSASKWQSMGRGILQVTGVQAAVVQNVGEVAHVDSPKIFDVIRGWEPKNLCEQSYITGESLLDAYCTTIRAGYLAERWPRVAAPSLCEWKEQYLATLSSSSSAKATISGITSNADLYWCSKLVQGRRFIETDDGYIGLAPSGALRGECAC